MKTIQRSLLISLFPLLTPLTAFAESDKQSEVVRPVPGTKGNAASWRASQVLGLNVKNAASETIGEVEDLVLDMKGGEVLAVIISSGGFLGIADTLSAVPVSVLRYDETAKAFKTRLTKEQLGKAPQFKSDAWPDYNDDSSQEKLRSYRDSISAEFSNSDDTETNVTATGNSERNVKVTGNSERNANVTTNSSRDTTAPDNSAQNEKEMKKDAANPTDQGNSDKDLQITKDIRSGIMDKDLSFNAKNIKIITRNEHVILKGVVESHAEHEAVLKIAGNHANSGKITDDLKVNSK